MTTATTQEKAPDDLPARFAEWLAGLAERNDRAALAALRRGLGKDPGTVSALFPYIQPRLPPELHPQRERAAYTTASLFGLLPRHRTTEGYRAARGFGAALRAIRLREGTTDEDDGVSRRFVALLDCDREALPEHLRQLFSLLKSRSEETTIDYAQLFRDIVDWDQQGRRVQRAWAAGFWAPFEGQGNDANNQHTTANENQD